MVLTGECGTVLFTASVLPIKQELFLHILLFCSRMHAF